VRLSQRRYLTRLDLDECQRQIWLLAGGSDGLPPYVSSRTGLIRTFIFASADERGFALSFATFGASVYGPSDITVRGAWRPTPEGTVIDIWYAPKLRVFRAAAVLIAILILVALLPSISPRFYRAEVGEGGQLLIAGVCVLWLLAMALGAMTVVGGDKFRTVAVHQLRAVEFPPGADPARLVYVETPEARGAAPRHPRRRGRVVARKQGQPLRG
jgi:hypothetical protein